jgi:hypothetical protein
MEKPSPLSHITINDVAQKVGLHKWPNDAPSVRNAYRSLLFRLYNTQWSDFKYEQSRLHRAEI